MPTITNALRRNTTVASLFVACVLLMVPQAMAQTGDAQYFTEVAPGVVKDSRTGLEWMCCSLGQQWQADANDCSGKVKYYTWQEAQDIAKKLNAQAVQGGRAEWRLPTIRELQSIRYCSKGFGKSAKDLQDAMPVVPSFCNQGSVKPTIDQSAFRSTPETFYWSSNTDAENASSIWGVSFGNGLILVNNHNWPNAVRLVRY